jgi:hypothetical protein
LGRKEATHTLRSGVLYFAIVFGAGFVLGPIRILWAAPRFGPNMAELMEMPIMLVVIVVAARWIVRGRAAIPSHRLGIGGVALALMLLAEFTFVLWLRGLSLREYVARLDPVSGTAYCLMLVVFALMPLLVGSDRQRASRPTVGRGAPMTPGRPEPQALRGGQP